MAELPLIDPDRIVTDAAHAMLSRRAESGLPPTIVYNHGPRQKITMTAEGTTLSVIREPGETIKADLVKATPAALKALAAAARNTSSGVPSPDML